MPDYKVNKDKGTFTVTNPESGEDEEHPITQGYVNHQMRKFRNPQDTKQRVRHENYIRSIRDKLGGKSYDDE